MAPCGKGHWGEGVHSSSSSEKQWQYLLRENKSKNIPNPAKCCGCDPLTIQSSGFVTSVGFEMSLDLVLNRMKINTMYLTTLQAGYQSASNVDCFTGDDLVFSAWFIPFIYQNIYAEKFCKNRYKNSLTFSSPLLYDLSVTVFLGNAEAWSISLCFSINFLLCAHVPSLASAGTHYVCS